MGVTKGLYGTRVLICLVVFFIALSLSDLRKITAYVDDNKLILILSFLFLLTVRLHVMQRTVLLS